MADGVSGDASEVRGLARDMGEASANALPFLRAAVQHTSLLVKTSWRDKASGNRFAPAFPASITYDTVIGDSEIRSEIGPDKDRPQGALGNLIEFGSVNNPPRGYGQAALAENEDDFERGLSIAIDDALRASGL
jgi:hypothetical protein